MNYTKNFYQRLKNILYFECKFDNILLPIRQQASGTELAAYSEAGVGQ